MPTKCYFEPYSRWVLSAFCALIVSIKPIEVFRSTWYHLCHFEVICGYFAGFCVPRPLSSNSISRCGELGRLKSFPAIKHIKIQ